MRTWSYYTLWLRTITGNYRTIWSLWCSSMNTYFVYCIKVEQTFTCMVIEMQQEKKNVEDNLASWSNYEAAETCIFYFQNVSMSWKLKWTYIPLSRPFPFLHVFLKYVTSCSLHPQFNKNFCSKLDDIIWKSAIEKSKSHITRMPKRWNFIVSVIAIGSYPATTSILCSIKWSVHAWCSFISCSVLHRFLVSPTF